MQVKLVLKSGDSDPLEFFLMVEITPLGDMIGKSHSQEASETSAQWGPLVTSVCFLIILLFVIHLSLSDL